MKNFKYIILLVMVTILWGGSFLIVKDLTTGNAPVFFMTAFRFLLGGIVIYIIKRIKKEPPLSKADIIHGSVVGLALFLAFAFQTFGIKYTTPAKNGMITGIYVIFVPIIISIIKRKIDYKIIIDGVLCFFGVFVLFGAFKIKGSFGIGDFLTLVSAFMFAVQFILLEKHSPNLNSWNFTLVQLISVSIFSLISAFLFEDGTYGQMNIVIMLPRLIFLGVFSTAFAYFIQTLVQAKLKASTASVIACLESVFSVAFSLIFGYDELSFSLIFGSIIIMISVYSAVVIKRVNS